jgi:hypothetical protein
MCSEYQIVKKSGVAISERDFKTIEKNHKYIGEKLILDVVNGVKVVASDLNKSGKKKEKGFTRLWDATSGNAKKRQNIINQNLIEGVSAVSDWLLDHDRHLSRIDLRIKDVADELWNTQNEILDFYDSFSKVGLRVEDLENFRKNAEKKFEEIEKRLATIEAQQHIDREIERLKHSSLPNEIKIFTAVDNLASGEFGIWYALSDKKTEKIELLTYMKNKMKSIFGKDFIDHTALYLTVSSLSEVERKAIGFIGNQYRQFNDSTFYDVIDLLKIAATTKNKNEFEKKIEESPLIRTIIRMDEFIEDISDFIIDAA